MSEFLPGFATMGQAHFSPCEKYRYTLWRDIRPYTQIKLGTCVFIMLNPSTADATKNDPTVRRCVGYATDWGFAKLLVLNAFAFRGTDPMDMKAAEEPVGEENDQWIRDSVEPKNRVVVAWGKDGRHLDRDLSVMNSLTEVGVTPVCLGTNLDGTPKHPLYLRKDLQPTPYLGREHHLGP